MSLKGLWISAIVILLLAAFQGLTGHWIVFFLLWPGGKALGQALVQIVIRLPNYHIFIGFAVGIVSVLVFLFAFLSRSHILVRIFAVLGFIIVVVTVLGGFLYVTSGLQDRLSLGQMADAFVGVFAAYFILVVFLFKTAGFSRGQGHTP